MDASVGADLRAIVPHMSPDCWNFLARWLLSTVDRDSLFRISHFGAQGLGLRARDDIPAGTELPLLWGLPITVPKPQHDLLQAENLSFVCKTSLTEDNPPPPFEEGAPQVVLGPINLANHACLNHSSLSPEALDAPTGPRPPPSFLAPTDWRVVHTPDAVDRGGPLTIFYGAAEDHPCPSCPTPLLLPLL